MNTEFQVSRCKKCNAILSEQKNEPISPCPVCGEKGRIHDEALTENIGFYDHMRMKGKHREKESHFLMPVLAQIFISKKKNGVIWNESLTVKTIFMWKLSRT